MPRENSVWLIFLEIFWQLFRAIKAITDEVMREPQ